MKNVLLIKNNIEKKGYIELKNYIKKKQLLILKKFVKQKLKENKNQYFFLTSENKVKTILHSSSLFNKIEDLLKKITLQFGKKINEKEKLYKVLRVVTGKKSKKVSLDYHFDAHLLTLLIPIYIPKRRGSDNGNLVIFKNLRKLTKNIYKNIIQKLFYQSYFFKIFFISTGLIKGEILNLVPGNVYIFNGFRTLHTNLQINPIDIRATILVHYHDIFIDSYLVKKNREIRIQNEIKNIKKNKIT
jgi:hypothetical protein